MSSLPEVLARGEPFVTFFGSQNRPEIMMRSEKQINKKLPSFHQNLS